MKVQTQMYNIFPRGLESLQPDGGRLSPPDLPLGQHNVHPGEGRQLLSTPTEIHNKDSRCRSPLRIRNCHPRWPFGSQRLLHPLQVREPLRWWEIAVVAKSISGIVSRGRAVFAATFPAGSGNYPKGEERSLPLQIPPWDMGTAASGFPPGTDALVTGGKTAIVASGYPHQSRTRVTGIGGRGKGETRKDRSSAIGVVCKGSSGPGTFAAGGRAATTARVVPGAASRVYWVETTTARQYKPVARARKTGHCGRAVKNTPDHPRGVCVVHYPTFGSGSFAPGGKATIFASFVHGTAANACRERTAGYFKLPYGSSASVANHRRRVCP